MKKNNLFWIPRSIIIVVGLVFLFFSVVDIIGILFKSVETAYIEILFITALVSFLITYFVKKNMILWYFLVCLTGFLSYAVICYYFLDVCGTLFGIYLKLAFICFFIPALINTLLFIIFSKKNSIHHRESILQ